MKKLLFLPILISLFSSCEKSDLLLGLGNNIIIIFSYDYYENDQYYDKTFAIDDSSLIKVNRKNFKYIYDEKAYATTPSCYLAVYKNNKQKRIEFFREYENLKANTNLEILQSIAKPVDIIQIDSDEDNYKKVLKRLLDEGKKVYEIVKRKNDYVGIWYYEYIESD